MKNPFSQDWSYFLAELDKRGFLSLVAKPLKSVCVTCFSWKKKILLLARGRQLHTLDRQSVFGTVAVDCRVPCSPHLSWSWVWVGRSLAY